MGEPYFTEKEHEFMVDLRKQIPNAEIKELFTLECDEDFGNMKIMDRKPVGWNRTDADRRESLSKYFVEGEE